MKQRKQDVMNLRRSVDPRHSSRWATTALPLMLSALAVGCASTTNDSAHSPDEQRVLIARPCEPALDASSRLAPVAVALEVAAVADSIGTPTKRWLATNPVRLHSVARLVLPLTANTSERAPFSSCSDPACAKSEDATLEVSMIGAPTDASAPVELRLAVIGANGSSRRLSLKTKNQEPATASLAMAPKRSLVVTPYYLFEPRERSVELLLQCAARDAGPIRVGEGPTSIPPIEREH